MLFVDGCAQAPLGVNSADTLGSERAKQLSLSPFGDGLFETMLLVNGRIHLLDLHLRRLQEGAERLHFLYSLDQIQLELANFLRHYHLTEGCFRLRLCLQRAAGTHGYSVQGLAIHRLISATAIAFPAVSVAHVTLSNVKLADQPLLAGIKHTNRLEQVLARAKLESTEFDEALMSDRHGCIIEAIAANLFVLEGDRLLTPPIESSGVKGVARSWLMSHSSQFTPEFAEEPLTLARILAADAVMLCSAISGFRQVISYKDQQNRRQWHEHEICQSISKQFVGSAQQQMR